jgi:hypothetical protein|tara:strand:- start:1550 stop:2356 length:807 start_codon:yes stop_codon:yes gene_type:complete
MYIDFSGGGKGAANKGSVSDLTKYLNKEQKELAKERKQPEYFFDMKRNNITKREVDRAIDGQSRNGLGKKDAKFYMISVNPSKKELAHISNDPQRLKEWIQKEYMPRLIKDFKRDGLTPENVNMFAKLEYHRYHKGTDKEVKNSIAKSGQRKDGNNMHVHIVIGRRSKDGKFKLSPNANARMKGQQGVARNAGFDRNSHKIAVEQSFDKSFGYKRGKDESFELKQMMKGEQTVEGKIKVLEGFMKFEKQAEVTKAIKKEIDKGMDIGF